MSQKISSGLALTLIFFVAGTIGLLLWLGNERGMSVDDPRFFAFEKPAGNHNWLRGKNENIEPGEEELGDHNFCSLEMKVCPNGSYVGRNPENNCEFNPCTGEGDMKVWTVDNLLSSALPEETEVAVRGYPGDCADVNAGPDYEGPGSGCYLKGESSSIHFEGFSALEYDKEKEIIITGKTIYCGGKKIPKYLCGLTGARLYRDNANAVVGNDRDSYGCIGSAGYQWCEEKQKCLRIWEEECEICGKEGDLIGESLDKCCDGFESVPLSNGEFGGLFECRKK